MSKQISVGLVEVPEIALYDPFGSNRSTVRKGSALISQRNMGLSAPGAFDFSPGPPRTRPLRGLKLRGPHRKRRKIKPLPGLSRFAVKTCSTRSKYSAPQVRDRLSMRNIALG